MSQFNFLGVVMNSTLKWDKHIAHISLKNFQSNIISSLYIIIFLNSTDVLDHYYIFVIDSVYSFSRIYIIFFNVCIYVEYEINKNKNILKLMPLIPVIKLSIPIALVSTVSKLLEICLLEISESILYQMTTSLVLRA